MTAAIGWGLDATNDITDPLCGATIGDVTIIRPIAEGGMGRVYEGLQDKPRRPVAVKVIRPGYASREAISRFGQEAEVLGSLDHEYIAHIYQAGFHACDGGRVPYFVMQYIADALPLTAYADKHGKSPSERLELFRKVCDAVAHGHAMKPRSVVHRDLKPSDILVDRRGNPKVIDFGIARCIDTDPAADAGFTTAGHVLGTVQYMSPEQFRGDRSAIDSRTDVWALGVILHELLAGQPPYDAHGMSAYEAAQVAWQYRPSWSEELNARLGQPLLDVIAKCLHQDRDERFADAGALLTALHNVPAAPPASRSVTGSAVVTAPSVPRSRFNRRTALLAGGAVAAIGTSVLLNTERIKELFRIDRPTLDPTPESVKPAEQSAFPFTCNGRRYEIVFAPLTRDDAVAKAMQRGGRLALIATAAELRAVGQAAIAADSGLVHLWADRGAGYATASGNDPVLAIMPPVWAWSELSENAVAGGYVCTFDGD